MNDDGHDEALDRMLPYVSVMMPVHGRPLLVAAALSSYVRQDYPPDRRQLIVVDDSPESLWELFEPLGAGIAYVRPDLPAGTRMTIAAKRNMSAELADGDILVHFDSDDVSTASRITQQVHTLLSTPAPVTGYHTISLFDTLTNRSYVYHSSRKLCAGTSLAYTREWWRGHRFVDEDFNTGRTEDLPYTTARELVALDGAKKLVALLHDQNSTTRRQVERYPQVFREVPTSGLPQFFFHFRDLIFCYNSLPN